MKLLKYLPIHEAVYRISLQLLITTMGNSYISGWFFDDIIIIYINIIKISIS